MRCRIVRTNSFPAIDGLGRRHTIEVYTTYLVDEVDGTQIEGVKELRTTTGEAVNRREKGQYELLDGTKLTSDAENAE